MWSVSVGDHVAGNGRQLQQLRQLAWHGRAVRKRSEMKDEGGTPNQYANPKSGRVDEEKKEVKKNKKKGMEWKKKKNTDEVPTASRSKAGQAARERKFERVD